MNKQELVNKASVMLAKTKFNLKKHGPMIMLVGGAVGVVTGTVSAVIATTKVPEIVEDHKTRVNDVRDNYAEANDPKAERRDVFVAYSKTAGKFIKVYAPAIIIESLSLTCMVCSNEILRKRAAAIGASYVALDSTFKDYRRRVSDKYGEDVDNQMLYGTEQKKITSTMVTEDGKEVKVKENATVYDPNNLSKYSRVFDASNPDFSKSPSMNRDVLNMKQNFCNNLLKAQGHLFLNDVYKTLGYKPTPEGQIMGWLYEPDDPKYADYSHVSFGYAVNHPDVKKYVGENEDAIVLDFNVMPILEKI